MRLILSLVSLLGSNYLPLSDSMYILSARFNCIAEGEWFIKFDRDDLPFKLYDALFTVMLFGSYDFTLFSSRFFIFVTLSCLDSKTGGKISLRFWGYFCKTLCFKTNCSKLRSSHFLYFYSNYSMSSSWNNEVSYAYVKSYF